MPVATITSTTGEIHLDGPCQQRGLDILQALPLEAALLVVLARERLHDSDRREDLSHEGDQRALLLPDVARRGLDAPRETVHHHEEHGRDRQRDQREPPVQVEHHTEDADQRQRVGQDAQEGRGDEVLNALDIAGHPADQVARAFLVVFGERQAVDVVVERAPQVVHHPLSDVRGQVGVQIGTERAEDGDRPGRKHRDIQDRERAAADPADHRHQPPGQGPGLKQVVQHDLERPGIEQGRRRFARHGDQRERHGLPVRPKEARDAESLGGGECAWRDLSHARARTGMSRSLMSSDTVWMLAAVSTT